MQLFCRGKDAGSVYLGAGEDVSVQIAVQNLISDIEKVCGVRPGLVHERQADTRIVVGTAVSDVFPEAICRDSLCTEDGNPRWEAYLQQEYQGCLYLCGNDRRGAIYAVYDFCEQIGVSPWYDMADVPVKKRDCINVEEGWQRADWPSVKYRGIFLNDEEELDFWAKKNTKDGTIGPELYEKIFELILRLKGNYIWPAMHVNAFNLNPENGRLAQRMGIVTGTSHCDMLHCSNQNEWKPWVEKKGYEGLRYDYTIPGTNRERLLEYWRDSLIQNREFEACYTIGMRGIHDSGFVTENLSDGQDTPEELMRKRRELLEEIMQQQRKLIREVIGDRQVPQSFVPYKEVLPIYDSGLKVPEDVTLVWVDDNFGYVRRYPNAQEQKRPGGNGLYYHSSYWAHPGMSYLFLGSIPLAQMGNELKKCYEQGIRQMWVDNVGALKPLEQDMEYFLRFGWDAARKESIVHDSRAWTRQWIDRNFSGNHGAKAADIYVEFMQLSNLCKPEHMRSQIFSQTNYTDEAGERVWRMYELSQQAQEIAQSLPREEQDAFFELFLMKIKVSFLIAASYYFADRSIEAYEQGAMRCADANLIKSREMDDLKRFVLDYYNHDIAGGRWDGILTPEEFPPPTIELFPACRPALHMEEGRMLVRTQKCGQGEALVFEQGKKTVRWFELRNSGRGTIPYEICPDPGIFLSKSSGELETEERIFVSLDQEITCGKIEVHSREDHYTIRVCCAASEGYLHMDSSAALRTEGFVRIPCMGRGRGDVMEAQVSAKEQGAFLEYAFELKQDCASPILEVIRFLTLNSTGQIGMEISVDGKQCAKIDSETTDEWLGNWVEGVMKDGEKCRACLPALAAGRHLLRITTRTPYLSLCAWNLYLDQPLDCMMGPGMFDSVHEIPSFDPDRLSGQLGRGTDTVKPSRMVIADRQFWQEDMLFGRNRMEPFEMIPKRSYRDLSGQKDVLKTVRDYRRKELSDRLVIDAISAFCEDTDAWTEAGTDVEKWSHRQGEQYGRTSVPVCIPARQDGKKIDGPSLNYRIVCQKEGLYCLEMITKHDDRNGFWLSVLIDKTPMEELTEECHSGYHSYRTGFMWCRQWIGDVRLSAGEHILTVKAGTTGVAIDTILLTRC